MGKWGDKGLRLPPLLDVVHHIKEGERKAAVAAYLMCVPPARHRSEVGGVRAKPLTMGTAEKSLAFDRRRPITAAFARGPGERHAPQLAPAVGPWALFGTTSTSLRGVSTDRSGHDGAYGAAWREHGHTSARKGSLAAASAGYDGRGPRKYAGTDQARASAMPPAGHGQASPRAGDGRRHKRGAAASPRRTRAPHARRVGAPKKMANSIGSSFWPRPLAVGCRVVCKPRMAFASAMSVRHSGSGCAWVSQPAAHSDAKSVKRITGVARGAARHRSMACDACTIHAKARRRCAACVCVATQSRVVAISDASANRLQGAGPTWWVRVQWLTETTAICTTPSFFTLGSDAT